MVRRLVRRALKNVDCEVLEAGDASAAVSLVEREKPDLVLLDMHMPELDGIAALSDILEIDPGVPVIMVTGDGDAARVDMALERGARDYISKPFDLVTLETCVTAFLLM